MSYSSLLFNIFYHFTFPGFSFILTFSCICSPYIFPFSSWYYHSQYYQFSRFIDTSKIDPILPFLSRIFFLIPLLFSFCNGPFCHQNFQISFFYSLRLQLMKATVLAIAPYISSFLWALSATVMSTDMSQVGVTLLPSF